MGLTKKYSQNISEFLCDGQRSHLSGTVRDRDKKNSRFAKMGTCTIVYGSKIANLLVIKIPMKMEVPPYLIYFVLFIDFLFFMPRFVWRCVVANTELVRGVITTIITRNHKF